MGIVMDDTTIKLQEENQALQRQVLQETIRRLAMEKNAGEATMSFIQLRTPMIEQEMREAVEQLKRLTPPREK